MPDNIPLRFSRPLRVSRIHLSWTDFYLWLQWRTCQSWCSLANALRAARWWGVRIKPTDVPCCKSVCREKAVLCLNRLADKMIYLSCWFVVALLRPYPALLEYWPVSWNLHQAWEVTLGDNPNLLATRHTDEPSWSNWTAWAASHGCGYLTMFTMEVIGWNAKGKRWISNVYCQ